MLLSWANSLSMKLEIWPCTESSHVPVTALPPPESMYVTPLASPLNEAHSWNRSDQDMSRRFEVRENSCVESMRRYLQKPGSPRTRLDCPLVAVLWTSVNALGNGIFLSSSVPGSGHPRTNAVIAYLAYIVCRSNSVDMAILYNSFGDFRLRIFFG